MSEASVLVPADIRFPLERANGVQIVKTAAALARAGVLTTLVVRRSDPRPTEEILDLYGVVPHANLLVRRLTVLHRRGSYLVPRATFLARALAAAVAALARGDRVLTRDLQLADLLVGLRARRVVYEAHAVESLMYGERGVLYGTGERPDPAKASRIAARERRVWRRAAGVVTTTAGIRDSFAEAYGPRDRVRVVPNGCDVPPSRDFPGLSREEPPRVLYAGQLYPWKGVDVLVEAVAQVPAARLVVLGGLEGEADLARVRGLVAARGLAERTEMPGTVPPGRVAEELARAAVVAVPFLRTAMTARHTSPLKAFEAMAAGRPVVATDLPSSREVLRDGENALLVPPGDAGALAAALRRVLVDGPLADRLARTAYAEAPRYSWDARAGNLLRLLEEVS
ncbi:MAG: glycosyltransferase family 4 protein [Acidobacteria bacterium]|nr:glycosyltransferase family 4 protein [Acidobacteriota bacterium]